MRLSCDKLYITTNDGSYERKGLVTDILRESITNKKVDLVYAIGSVEMMQAVCALTKKNNIETSVSIMPYARLDFEERGLDEVARASVHYYNTEEEVHRFCKVVASN